MTPIDSVHLVIVCACQMLSTADSSAVLPCQHVCESPSKLIVLSLRLEETG